MSTFVGYLKRFSASVGIILLITVLTGCTLNANISDLNAQSQSKSISLKIQNSNSSVDITEGSTLVLIISQTEPLDTDSTITLSIEDLAFPFNNSFSSPQKIVQTLSAGSSSVSFTINSLHDLSSTGTKTYKLLVSSENNKVIGTQIDLNIIDLEDGVPSLIVNNVTVTEGQNAILNFSLSHAHNQPVSFDYSTISGTALSGTDFVNNSGTLTIPTGSTSQNLSITTSADLATICSANKTFTVQVSNVLNANFSGTNPTVSITDPDRPSISIANATGTEGSSISFTVTLSSLCPNYDARVNWQTSASGTAINNVDFTQANGSVTIPKGTLTASLNVATIQDSITESSESFSVTLSSPIEATLSASISAVGTIQDDDFGSFNISGVASSSEGTIDAYLSNSTIPDVYWTSSTGATNYDVSIYEDDGTTIKCPISNTTNTYYSFSSCTLSPGSYYKISVEAKSGTGSKLASNSLYRFYVNRSPILHTLGSGPYFVMAGSSITINAQGGAAPIVGIANDPESETITISDIGTPSKGTITASSDTSFTLSTSSTDFGKSTINIVVLDPHEGTLNTTIQVNIMQAYTWTGAQSTNFNTSGNWCGAIAADKRSCTGATGSFANSDILYFDDTCSSSYTCTPTLSANLNAAGIRINANGFSQGPTNTITIGSSGWTQSGGSFTGGNGNIQISSSLSVTNSGTFTATSGNLSILGGGMSLNSNFTHNNGKVTLNTSTNNFGSTSNFYDLTISMWNAHALNLQNNIIVLNNLDLQGAGSTEGYQFDVYGNISSSRSGSGSSKLRILGSNNQTIQSASPGNIPPTKIQKTGGLLTGGAIVTISGGEFQLISGNIDLTNTSLNISGGGGNIINIGNNQVKNLSIGIWSSGSLYINNDINVINTFSLGGNGTILPGIPNVKVSAGGDVYINLGCGCWGGTIHIEMTGSTDSTLKVSSSASGGTIAGSAFGGNLIINKNMDGTVILDSNLVMQKTGQNLIINSGNLNMMGYNITTLGLSLNSTTIIKNSGILTVNSTIVGTGSLYGGTISP